MASFITLEGCEGVGKSTQAAMLEEYLAASGQKAVFLREPGGTPISEKLRDIILDVSGTEMTARCETLLYCASRAQLVGQVIAPALKSGVNVVCDRFSDSTAAYQGVARGLGYEQVKALSDFACDGLKPDLTLFFDLPPSRAFARKGGADRCDRLESENAEFHRKVYEGYITACVREPARIVRIDAHADAQTIHGAVLDVLRKRGVIL